MALTLEVEKFESEQSSLQSEVDRLRKTLEHQCELDDELSNLESDIHSMDTKVASLSIKSLPVHVLIFKIIMIKFYMYCRKDVCKIYRHL